MQAGTFFRMTEEVSETEHRYIRMQDMQTREATDGKRYLEGYFAVFNSAYEVVPGWVETIAPGAFARYLSEGKGTKALWNHDSNIVLGNTANSTLTLREDETGLRGSIEINEADTDALNAYARVQRGDVEGCSFGFDIARQDEWWDDEGIYHTVIREVDPQYEVSPCTFPAYSATSISARSKLDELAQARERRLEKWRCEMLKKLKGDN